MTRYFNLPIWYFWPYHSLDYLRPDVKSLLLDVCIHSLCSESLILVSGFCLLLIECFFKKKINFFEQSLCSYDLEADKGIHKIIFPHPPAVA